MRGLVFGIALLAGCTPLSEMGTRFGGNVEPGEPVVQRGEVEYFHYHGGGPVRVQYPLKFACPPKLEVRCECSSVTEERADGFTFKSDYPATGGSSGLFLAALTWEATGRLPKGVEVPPLLAGGPPTGGP